jgi:hypothetical protein
VAAKVRRFRRRGLSYKYAVRMLWHPQPDQDGQVAAASESPFD